MKICVLFGSFNPLTNAHVRALRSAVDAVGADKGLFVATNGKYLKRKTVKTGDPFYLPEDERKAIIEKVCEPEFKNKFRLLVFAILERPKRPQGLDGHFAPFYHEFGTYTAE